MAPLHLAFFVFVCQLWAPELGKEVPRVRQTNTKKVCNTSATGGISQQQTRTLKRTDTVSFRMQSLPRPPAEPWARRTKYARGKILDLGSTRPFWRPPVSKWYSEADAGPGAEAWPAALLLFPHPPAPLFAFFCARSGILLAYMAAALPPLLR